MNELDRKDEQARKGFTIEMNTISVEAKHSLKVRTITALCILSVAIPCVLFGSWAIFGLLFILLGVAIYEFMHITGKKYSWYVWLVTYLATYSYAFWVFFQRSTEISSSVVNYDRVTMQFSMVDIRVSTIAAVVFIAFLFAVAIFHSSFEIKDAFYIFTMSLFIGTAFQAVLFLRYSSQALASDGYVYSNPMLSCLLIAFVEMGVALNDLFAYLTGMLFGKHKMNPRVSPKKTWEGFFGGILLSTIITSLFVFLLDKFAGVPVLKGIFDSDHLFLVILVSVGICISGVLGDLMFSLIKRHYAVKDYSNIFPGHGGVLDRFDSLLITALLVSVMITFIYYNPLIGAGI